MYVYGPSRALKMLAFHPTGFNPDGGAFAIERDLDVIDELDKEENLYYDQV